MDIYLAKFCNTEVKNFVLSRLRTLGDLEQTKKNPNLRFLGTKVRSLKLKRALSLMYSSLFIREDFETRNVKAQIGKQRKLTRQLEIYWFLSII